MQQVPAAAPRTQWPELVAYDGRMAARAIQDDRPDVRVIVVREDDWSEDHEREVNEQYALSDSAWAASVAPLTCEQRHLELVVLLRVRQCRGARPQDTAVTEPPFAMRRRLLSTAAADNTATPVQVV